MGVFKFQEYYVCKRRLSKASVNDAAHIALSIIVRRDSVSWEDISKSKLGIDLDADSIPLGLNTDHTHQVEAIRDSHDKIKAVLEDLLRTDWSSTDFEVCVINSQGTSNLRGRNDAYGFIRRSSAEGIRDTNLQVRMGLGKVIVATNRKVASGLLPESSRETIVTCLKQTALLHSGDNGEPQPTN